MLCLFDLDGTLIDSQEGIFACIEHALTGLDVEPPRREALRAWIGPPLWHSFATMLGEEDEARIREAIGRYRERYHDVGWREHAVYPDIDAALSTLKDDGHRLAVVTSKPLPQAERIIAHLPFGQDFERIYAPHPDDHAHTKQAMIAQALADFGTTAEECAMAGDRRFDMEGARANGVHAVGVLWGFGSSEELNAAGACILAPAPATLADAMRGFPLPP